MKNFTDFVNFGNDLRFSYISMLERDYKDLYFFIDSASTKKKRKSPVNTVDKLSSAKPMGHMSKSSIPTLSKTKRTKHLYDDDLILFSISKYYDLIFITSYFHPTFFTNRLSWPKPYYLSNVQHQHFEFEFIILNGCHTAPVLILWVLNKHTLNK